MEANEPTEQELHAVGEAMRAIVERDLPALERMGALPAPDGSRDI